VRGNGTVFAGCARRDFQVWANRNSNQNLWANDVFYSIVYVQDINAECVCVCVCVKL